MLAESQSFLLLLLFSTTSGIHNVKTRSEHLMWKLLVTVTKFCFVQGGDGIGASVRGGNKPKVSGEPDWAWSGTKGKSNLAIRNSSRLVGRSDSTGIHLPRDSLNSGAM